MSNHQSPYMLETASDYLRAAKVLWKEPNLGLVAVVNAAIAIEIILKSFIAQPSENDRKGTISEQYEIKGKRLHTLTDLAKAIDSDLYNKLGFHRHEYWFQKFDNLFVQSRYPYEPTSSGGYSDTPIQIGIEMFRSTINWYKQTENPDPWVIMYPDVAGGGL
ncbi:MULTISPECIES: hypothetical protein [unclassified Shewanella]|uniref:hypothetical protein n=1 Tax=unclassified Shewanella TaxID=196818 RepID=UPI001BC556FD|nr:MULTISPECIES: hypothetical protein [unclassified Shewanella]GIU04821.1 hypothetical protein TUM4444_00170 [Shewanella sp. MBTL60-112-B1]GIU24744.1 hypothetical protein TUM4445_02200 [Shewanella sp. MBTL60-112-B2]